MSSLNNIDNTFEGFQKLIHLYEENKDKMFSHIHIELHQWFAANMSAVLGAVLDKFTADLNDIHFDHITQEIEGILLKNDFLTYYGKQRALDTNNTTIKFQKLKLTDGKYFKNYVIEELIEGRIVNLLTMSNAVKEKIVEGIYEIFVNAQIHSGSPFIYTCGQFFPGKHEIAFTIVDIGIGFKEKINQRFDSNLSAIQAIKWAVQDKKTTKIGVSGGIGLAVLKEFIELNKGKMQIVSSDGFYQFDSQGEQTSQFVGQFPGTIVNLQFNTNDSHNYSLKNEIDINNIF
jgi:hypothetical protein